MEEKIETVDISFKEIFNCLKAGWKRVLVYAIIAVLVFTSAFLLVKEAIGVRQFETLIRVTSNNETNTNWNTTKNIEQMVKSSVLVKDALTTTGINSEKQEELIKKGLIEDISAVAQTMIKNEKGEEFPETIRVSVKENKKYGLSKDQYISLTSAIANSLLKFTIAEYTYEINIASNLTIDDSLNYLQQYNQYNNLLTEMENFLKTCEKTMSGFVSTASKSGIKDSLIKVEGLKLQLDAIRLNITSKEVISNSTKVSISEKDYAINKVAELTGEVAALQSQVTDYSTLLQNYKPEIFVNGQASVDLTTSYARALEIYNDLQTKLVNKKLELSNWELIKDAYVSAGDNSDAVNEEVKTKIAAYIVNYNNLAQKITQTLEDYNKNALSDEYLLIISPAKEAKESTSLTLVVCEVVVALVAVIVAFFVTKKKLNKDNK